VHEISGLKAYVVVEEIADSLIVSLLSIVSLSSICLFALIVHSAHASTTLLEDIVGA